MKGTMFVAVALGAAIAMPARAEPARPRRSGAEVGAGVYSSFASGGAAPGVLLDFFYAPSDGPWAAHVGALGTTAREAPFRGGQVSWYRAAGALGGR
jgi:hypothetical protein